MYIRWSIKPIEVVQQSGVRYEVGAMENNFWKGELDVTSSMSFKRAQQSLRRCWRQKTMITSIKIHYVQALGVTIDEKGLEVP
ncbi:hypothetical protein CW304_22760 [Bacillus sp. UFRGS-B20]|nr:hypothetical protein CW304_22760 [Bacillus sp. UFRGS-B20]